MYTDCFAFCLFCHIHANHVIHIKFSLQDTHTKKKNNLSFIHVHTMFPANVDFCAFSKINGKSFWTRFSLSFVLDQHSFCPLRSVAGHSRHLVGPAKRTSNSGLGSAYEPIRFGQHGSVANLLSVRSLGPFGAKPRRRDLRTDLACFSARTPSLTCMGIRLTKYTLSPSL